MAKYFKLTVSSMSMHSLLIKTPDNINEDDIHEVDEDEAKENGFDEWEEEDFKND